MQNKHTLEPMSTEQKKILYFTATWCGPCQNIKPKFYDLERQYEDISFNAIDVDLNRNMAESFDISAMPTFVFIHNDAEVNRMTGANKEKLEKMVKEFSKL